MGTEHRGFDYWRNTLKAPRHIVAPMVDASELAWRMFSRKYGAQLCYTPMLHSSVFVKDARYRKDNLESCLEDRPLIVQFCANDPDTFAKACALASPHCDGIDLNLGCPQTIAKKGHYGAFLMEEWTLISNMIKNARKEVDIPISAKIRIFPDLNQTLKYAKMLEDAGVFMLTVHGRTRDQKGALTGVADWDYIKAVCEAVSVPVIANGNIQYLEDVDRCLKATGAVGVMSAEGNLHNPAIFKGEAPPVWDMVLEYLEFVRKYPCPLSYSRGHVFKLMHHVFNMPENFDIRFRMSKASAVDAMISVTKDLQRNIRDYYEGKKVWKPEEGSCLANLPLPPWICQPYVRVPAEDHIRKLAESQQKAMEKRQRELNGNAKRGLEGEQELSRKKRKKLQRNPKKKFDQPADAYEKCICKNPRGSRCEYLLCRTCCKFKCHVENLECAAHKIRNRPRKEKPNETKGIQAQIISDNAKEIKNGSLVDTDNSKTNSENGVDENPVAKIKTDEVVSVLTATTEDAKNENGFRLKSSNALQTNMIAPQQENAIFKADAVFHAR